MQISASANRELKSGCFLQHRRLDEAHRLLSVRNPAARAERFQLLDVHQKNYLNNLQFYCFLRYATSLTKDQIVLLFDSLDGNATRRPRFKRLSVVACTLPSPERGTLRPRRRNRDPCPSSTPMDDMIDFNQFEATRFLFNIQKEELKKIFKDFDISGDEQLNCRRFKMFAAFCIDKQQRKEEGDHE
ncbi:EF-hand calcium-binding domain-containing protein 9 [Theristicus caerulescens]